MGDRKKRFGDRKDGRRVRTLDPYNSLAPFIMKTRGDSSNFISDSVEITEIDRYFREKRVNGYTGIGMLHLFIAAYIRTISQYPGINRFVSGQRVFARNNVEFIMTVKKSLSVDSGETSIKLAFAPGATINEVYEKLDAEIQKIKGDVETTSTDNVAGALMKIPRVFLKFAIRLLEFMDYFGLLPVSLVAASPFHGSIVVTDLGSIGLPAIHHHLYNFGNVPVFVAFGAKYRKWEMNSKGAVEELKFIDLKMVLDERICDGFYFSQAYKTMKSLLKNPRSLEGPPETIVEDFD